MKALVGIGDSWTQGQGGVPLRFWDEFPDGNLALSDEETEPILLEYELENSWVNVLCRDYYKDLIPINLGMRGYGNRGAVKNLYIYNDIVKNITGGIMIFVLSSRIRFDIMTPTGYAPGRRRFRTYYPSHGEENKYKPGEHTWYQKEYTEFLAKGETLLTIVEAQTWAKAHNLEFYFAAGIEVLDDLKDDAESHYGLADMINWRNYLTPNTSYYKYLNEINGTPNKTWGDYFKMRYPDKYITNDAHPTIKGYLEIAKNMYNRIEYLKKDIL